MSTPSIGVGAEGGQLEIFSVMATHIILCSIKQDTMASRANFQSSRMVAHWGLAVYIEHQPAPFTSPKLILQAKLARLQDCQS